ncbi:MAG: hypothetical protein II973_12320 [Spirochaetaceae bacterium]|nr:hypothetical protein [Spirochaetaceae bacterium]
METINTPLPRRQQTEYFSFCSRLIYNQSSIGKKRRFCGAKPAACVHRRALRLCTNHKQCAIASSPIIIAQSPKAEIKQATVYKRDS